MRFLLANLAIVVVGAFVGTTTTVWHVLRYPNDRHFELILVFVLGGIAISFLVNSLVLRHTLEPLDQLQLAVDQIRRGDTHVQVKLDRVTDEQFQRLVETFNQMVSELELSREQMQQLSRMILQAQEEERYRLARELHDEAAQSLTSLIVRLRLLERARNPEDAQQRVVELRELTARALEDVRRVSLDLRPTILDDLGLGPALEWRVDEFNKGDDVRATISISGLDRRLARDVELVLYRVGQESLSNVRRHAAATNVAVTLRGIDGTVILEIADDGVGFDPERVHPAVGHGLGLVGMRERVATIGGALKIDAAPGRGTRILVRVPISSERATS